MKSCYEEGAKTKVTGTLMNYYFHCKRQCYLFGNRMNLEDNSEEVEIGRALHEERDSSDNTEIAIENVRLDKLTKEYLTEVKKSDADVEASRWQLLLYLKILKEKGIIRKGKLEFIEKNKSAHKVEIVELTPELEERLKGYEEEIEQLLAGDKIPEVLNAGKCKKCAYYEYCYI